MGIIVEPLPIEFNGAATKSEWNTLWKFTVHSSDVYNKDEITGVQRFTAWWRQFHYKCFTVYHVYGDSLSCINGLVGSDIIERVCYGLLDVKTDGKQ